MNVMNFYHSLVCHAVQSVEWVCCDAACWTCVVMSKIVWNEIARNEAFTFHHT